MATHQQIIDRYLFRTPDGTPDWNAFFDVASFSEICLAPGDSRLQALVDPSFTSAAPILIKKRVVHSAEAYEDACQLELAKAVHDISVDPAHTGLSKVEIRNMAAQRVRTRVDALKAEAVAQETAAIAELQSLEARAWEYFASQPSMAAVVADIVSRFGADSGAVRAMIGSVARWVLSHEHAVAVDHLTQLSAALSSHEQTRDLGRVVGLVADWKSRAPGAAAMAAILNLPANGDIRMVNGDTDLGDPNSAIWWSLRAQILVAYMALTPEHALTRDLPSREALIQKTVFANPDNRVAIVRCFSTNVSRAIGIDDGFLIHAIIPLICHWEPETHIGTLFSNRYSQTRLFLIQTRFQILADKFIQHVGNHTDPFHSTEAWVSRMVNLPERLASKQNREIWTAMAQSVAEGYYPVLTRAQIFAFVHRLENPLEPLQL